MVTWSLGLYPNQIHNWLWSDPFLIITLSDDDAANNALRNGQDHLNDLPVNKGMPYLPDIFINPCHASIEILNHRFIVKQGPEQVDQVCKPGQNRCDKAPLLDTAVKLCLLEILCPLLDLLHSVYAHLHILPCQFGVNLTIIQIDRLQIHLASSCQYMCKALRGEEGLGWWKIEALLYFGSSASL